MTFFETKIKQENKVENWAHNQRSLLRLHPCRQMIRKHLACHQYTVGETAVLIWAHYCSGDGCLLDEYH